jgi:hypothetical protein
MAVMSLTGAMNAARMMFGQDMQRSSPRATIVDVGGLELSVRPGLVWAAVPLFHTPNMTMETGRLHGDFAQCSVNCC